MPTCAAGSGAFALSSTRQALGIQFSYPYYRTGLGVVIPTGQKQIDLFAFFKPLRIEVWLAFIGNRLLHAQWLVEQLMTEGTVFLDWDSLYEARQATYASMLAVFNLSVFKVRSLSAQLLILVFCFMVMIVMATYVANLAAALTAITMSQRFSSISDLRGRRVAAHSTYAPTLLSSYGVQANPLDFDGLPTFEDIIKAFRNNTMDAYVMDLPEIGYYVMAHNDACSVYGFIDFGFLFHKDLDPKMVAAFNTALFMTMEGNLVEQLASKFLLFLGALDKCASASENDAIEFKQLAGLWIIMASAIGFAFISCTISIVRRLLRADPSTDERKLSSVFVTGSKAHLARSGTSMSLNGRAQSMSGGIDASKRGGHGSNVYGGGTTEYSHASRRASFFEPSLGVMSVKVRPITPSSRANTDPNAAIATPTTPTAPIVARDENLPV
ncbi:hypothetical protein GPECTOR_35g926 [Gonium pectorale]|uniref:Ionotropic glutamate receptor C-terminal domain-containing protein n=1 Tax=Gonium pectorale TaxID=33097 RepID=A0A150GCE1_GONPE|nr:hypothetical protein GPECTOR_35g926 [Gonium pectorale]|eukprot:KXZ47488.1 hypothetical protein GPECTOR_35g926 [Gonium pectorale]